MRIGKYCKAYPLATLRAFEGWTERAENIRTDAADTADADQSGTADDEKYLFLQENFTVTDGIYLDQNVVFDDVTPAWQRYCAEVLDFHVPEF